MANDRTGDPAIGRRIADARNARDLTQIELAEKLNFSPGWIADIERGRRNVSVIDVGRIASALGVSTDSLIKGEPQNYEEWLRLQPYWEQLGPTDRRMLLDSYERQAQHRVAEARERGAV